MPTSGSLPVVAGATLVLSLFVLVFSSPDFGDATAAPLPSTFEEVVIGLAELVVSTTAFGVVVAVSDESIWGKRQSSSDLVVNGEC